MYTRSIRASSDGEPATLYQREDAEMPNWCQNTVYLFGDAGTARELRQLMTTPTSKFDFNQLLPMPENLYRSDSSPLTRIAWELKYGDWTTITQRYGPSDFDSREEALAAARSSGNWEIVDLQSRALKQSTFDELADAAQECILKYGALDWHDWALETWGTKWAAFRSGWMSPLRAMKREAEQVAYFDTAWDPPYPVLVALSERFPSLTLRVEFCQEDVSAHHRHP